MSEYGDVHGILKNLESYLRVTLEISENMSQTISPITIAFNVKNEAEYANVVFDEVQLLVGIPPNVHVEKKTNLAKGESFTYAYQCTYGEFTKIVYSVGGKVNPSLLLQIGQEGRKIPTKRQLSIKAYLEVLDELNIHKWLNDTLKTLPIPGPNTTLSTIKVQREKLGQAMAEISQAEHQLEDISKFVTKAEKVILHRKLVNDYLKRTQQGCGNLQQELGKSDTRSVINLLDSIVSRLEKEASLVDQATDRLSE